MDRITFIESISGIEYPEMLVEFFDQFIALKQLVDNYGKVTVNEKSNNSISFIVNFSNPKYKEKAVNMMGSQITIYGKPITVSTEILSDTDIKYVLH